MHRLVGLILILSLSSLPAVAESPRELARRLCRSPSDSEKLFPRVRRMCSECDPAITMTSLITAARIASENAPTTKSTERYFTRLTQSDGWGRTRIPQLEDVNRTLGSNRCPMKVIRFGPVGDRTLSFLATSHFGQIPKNQNSKLTSAIDQELTRIRGATVVVEGYPNPIPCDLLLETYLTTPRSLRSEAAYAIKRALHNGMKVRSGEPRSRQLTNSDVMFLLLRQISQEERTVARSAEKRDEVAFEQAIKALSGGGRNSPFTSVTYQSFSDWYRQVNKRNFSASNAFADITPSTYVRGEVRETNNLASRQTLRRDQSVVETVKQEISRGNRVVVLFGSGHLPGQLPAYESVFGRVARTPVARCYPGLIPSAPSSTQPPAPRRRSTAHPAK